MTRVNLLATTVCAIAMSGLPICASAQDLPIGKSVHVTALDGSRQGGRLVSLDGKTVVIEHRSGTANIPLAEVRIITRDSYAIPAGTFIGLGAGFFGGLMLCSAADDCPTGQATLMTAGIGAGIGAAAGILIKVLRADARVVYRAPAKTSLTMSPVVGRRQVGVRGVIAW